MATLITPSEVARLAFPSEMQPAHGAIQVGDIKVAEEFCLLPVIGQPLYERLLEGDYRELLTEYILEPLALWVRSHIQPRIDLHSSPLGTMAPKCDHGSSADASQCRALQRSLRCEARQMLLRLTRHLNDEVQNYPEYDPNQNIFNRIAVYGGFVQTL